MRIFLKKIKFALKRPNVVVVAGAGRNTAKEAIFEVLSAHFKINKDVFICDAGDWSRNDLKFFLSKSKLPILVVTHMGEYHPEKEFFAGELKDAEEAIELAKSLPSHGQLVLNYDDETVRDIHNQSYAHPLTFGMGARADIKVSDVVLTQFPDIGTNFKINYEGKTVPVWLERLFGKENIYAALAAAAVGETLGLNLVEISVALKRYCGVSGKLKIMDGIKKSFILDDSENASVLSMAEALDIINKIEVPGRKIAVLGDIVGVGKYTIEAHEAIGEKVGRTADLLFTIGDRAKFFAQGAIAKGMEQDNIFQFSDIQRAGIKLQEEIRTGDLVLVDGSKEMDMGEVVLEVKA
ncbi:MAG: Mur ligase family protein [Candidatus Paceibacterota bacterium]|jgi:UDP-N-acetylmuramoyl-tripeptide--D-alanyl-D-alanine ligase